MERLVKGWAKCLVLYRKMNDVKWKDLAGPIIILDWPILWFIKSINFDLVFRVLSVWEANSRAIWCTIGKRMKIINLQSSIIRLYTLQEIEVFPTHQKSEETMSRNMPYPMPLFTCRQRTFSQGFDRVIEKEDNIF